MRVPVPSDALALRAGAHGRLDGAGGLPAHAGVSLKSCHFRDVLDARPEVGFFEVHAENYMVDGGPFHHFLGRIRQDYALSLHGVGLSIGAQGALDEAHLARLAALIQRYEPASFSEHLAWSSHGAMFLNDLLPLPYDPATLQRVCEHIDHVQNRLGRRMLLENPATYLEFDTSTMSETQFLTEVLQRTGCGLLLDVNNVHVSCVNHGRDAHSYIDALPLGAVGEIHLAGFTPDRDAADAPLLIDSHGAPVADVVWALYERVVERIGPMATLLERDNDVPALPTLLLEVQRAQRVLDVAASARLVETVTQ